MIIILFKEELNYHIRQDLKDTGRKLTLLESQSWVLVWVFISSYVCSILLTSGFGKPGTTLWSWKPNSCSQLPMSGKRQTHTDTHVQTERKLHSGRELEYNVYIVKQTKSHKARETTPCTGNHTIFEHNALLRLFGWCFSHKHILSVINNTAGGKRDRPNECSINQKDVRPRQHPIFILLLSYSISFPCLSFYFVSRGNSMFLTDRGNKTQQSVLKKQDDHRHGCPFCCQYFLSVTSSLSVTQLTCG